MKDRGCLCGSPTKRRLSIKTIESLSKLRGYRIKLCVLCGHEVGPIRKATDIRKLAAFGNGLAHRPCVKAAGIKPRVPVQP